jgi:hypothetical protein
MGTPSLNVRYKANSAGIMFIFRTVHTIGHGKVPMIDQPPGALVSPSFVMAHDGSSFPELQFSILRLPFQNLRLGNSFNFYTKTAL